MCYAGCDELKKIDEKCKESSLFSYISSTLEVDGGEICAQISQVDII